ncbi:MAG TPA: adenosylcobinamide-phosphate synthase CbiB [Candidatus Binatia bacterium]|nr:adenosylcobinamide-phosphate synthase CbiB [Candidatus Binatia bacterium]
MILDPLDPPATLVVLAGALALDRALGEPAARLHPVVWMGWTVNAALRAAPRSGRAPQLAFGALLALAVPAAFGGASWLVLRACSGSRLLEIVIAIALLKPAFAVRALREAAFGVRDALAAGDVAGARAGLASLCSRDASRLGEPELVAGTVESIAENASDSAIAPLLWFVALGVPAAVAYRAVNTLDAMIGYHGATEWLGKAAARLDDAANVVPARLTALLLLAGGALAGGDVRSGWRVLARDGGATESPNAGRPMAAMAGLLGVALEKPGHYRLGDGRAPLVPATIDRAWAMAAAALAAGALLAAAGLVAAAALGGRP